MADITRSINLNVTQAVRNLERLGRGLAELSDNTSREMAQTQRSIDGVGQAVAGVGVAFQRVAVVAGVVAAGFIGISRALGAVARVAGTVASALARTVSAALRTAISLAERFVDRLDGVRKSLDAVGKTSTRLGIAVQPLRELQFAAQISGVEVRTLNLALQRLTRRLGESSLGMGEARRALTELGIPLDRFLGQSPDQQFEAIARALSTVTDESQRLALAVKFLDTEGAAVLQLFNQGPDAIRRLREEFRLLAPVLGEQQIRNVEGLGDAILRFQTQARGAFTRILVDLAPALTDVVNLGTRISGELIRGFRSVLPAVNELAGRVRLFIKDAGDDIVRFAGGLTSNFQPVLSALLDLFLVAGIEAGKKFAVGFLDFAIQGVKDFALAAVATNPVQAIARLGVAVSRGIAENLVPDPNAIEKAVDRLRRVVRETIQRGERVSLQSFFGIRPEDFVPANINAIRNGLELMRREALAATRDVGGEFADPTIAQPFEIEELGRASGDSFGKGFLDGLDQYTIQVGDFFTQAQRAAFDVAATLSNNLGAALGDVITRTRTAKEAFQDLARSVVEGIARIISQLLAELAVRSLILLVSGGAAAAVSGGQTAVSRLLGGISNSFRRGGAFPRGVGGGLPKRDLARGEVIREETTFRGGGFENRVGETIRPEAVLPLERAPGGDLGVRATIDGGGSRTMIQQDNRQVTVQNTVVVEGNLTGDANQIRQLERAIEDSAERAVVSALENNGGAQNAVRNIMMGTL